MEEEDPFSPFDTGQQFEEGLKIIRALQSEKITLIEATEKYYGHVKMPKKAIYRLLRIIKRTGGRRTRTNQK